MFIWTIWDLIFFSFAGICFLLIFLIRAYTWYIQATCKHDQGVGETMACDAICRSCGKNLGFIGAWRDAQKKGKKS